jgi:hypothetical protein
MTRSDAQSSSLRMLRDALRKHQQRRFGLVMISIQQPLDLSQLV